jgi:hypothetical protein
MGMGQNLVKRGTKNAKNQHLHQEIEIE